ncbi:hypothetical protein [Parabacteroides pacaensis]|uniref:hypothetical protein n=1 Tax=Parabacteroides pacaensis TaxID=2086575 RepID=UPI000D0EBFB2|nr:hypothetical protein [Parabacteroides pacaensis]
MKKVSWYIYLFILLGGLSSCSPSRKEKNEEITKKVMADYIRAFKKEMTDSIKQLKIEHDSTGIKNLQDDMENAIFRIRLKNYLLPNYEVWDSTMKAITYPDKDLYELYWLNFYVENEFILPPAKIFYIEGYPVLLYDLDLPHMKSEDIPQAIKCRRHRTSGTENGWLIGICKKTHKYIVFHNSYQGATDLTIIEKLNAFSCDD